MKKGVVLIIKDERWYCPECGHNKIKGAAGQCSEDCCEMWFECAKCGYNPAGPCDMVETIWGWEEEMAVFAKVVYCNRYGTVL